MEKNPEPCLLRWTENGRKQNWKGVGAGQQKPSPAGQRGGRVPDRTKEMEKVSRFLIAIISCFLVGAQSKMSACSWIVEAEQQQDDEPLNSLLSTLYYFWRMLWFASTLIGKFRLEMSEVVELLHSFLNLSKVVLPLMEAKIIESNNWFEAF